MKRKSILFGMALALLLSALAVGKVEAAEIRTKEATVAEDEVIADDLYISGEELSIEGVVEGDVLAGGSTVDISGDIYGDLYVAASVVDISGTVVGNVYVASGMLTLSGQVGGNLVFATGQSTASIDSLVAGDIVGASGTTTLNGFVGDDVRLASGMIRIDGDVTDDVVVTGGDISVNEDYVLGDVKIYEDADDAKAVADDVKVVVDPMMFKGFSTGITGFGLLVGFFVLVGRYIAGLLLFKVAPVKTEEIVENVSSSWEEFLKSLGIGALVTIAVPVLAFMLLFTLVGTSIAMIVLGLMLFIGLYGSFWVELAVGRVVLVQFKSKNTSNPLALLVGMFISLIKYLPLIGGLYKLALSWVSFGAIVRMKMDMWNNAKSKDKKKDKK